MERVLVLDIKPIDDNAYDWYKSIYKTPTNHLSRIEIYSKIKEICFYDSGFDVHCPNDLVIPKGAISFKIPLGIMTRSNIWYNDKKNELNSFPSSIELWPRSSCGSKSPLRLSNSIGLIDNGYRGELMAIVDNMNKEDDFQIKKGDRLFQLVAPGHIPIYHNMLSTDEELDHTERGSGGFGSTGR